MSLTSNNRRKSSTTNFVEKNKCIIKHDDMKSETHVKSDGHDHMDTGKKFEMPVFTSTHRKSDEEKSSFTDTQDKASAEPYVREFKEFAGVTIIVRTAPNQKCFGNPDINGRNGTRRKSEFQQSHLNMQDKMEHSDKTEHTGINYPVFSAKSDTLMNNFDDATNNNRHH